MSMPTRGALTAVLAATLMAGPAAPSHDPSPSPSRSPRHGMRRATARAWNSKAKERRRRQIERGMIRPTTTDGDVT